MSWSFGYLHEIADIIPGYAFKSEWFGEKGKKVIRIGDLQNGYILDKDIVYFDDHIHQVSDQFRIKKGDILMALSGATVGKTAVAQEKDINSYANQRIAIIRGKTFENSNFIKYLFSGSTLKKLLTSAGGAAQPNLSPKDLSNMEIPLPPIEEQKRIASILDKADAIRHKRQQAIQLADQFLHSVFLEMFGDPVTNPKNLKNIPLTEIANITTGYAFKSSDYITDQENAKRLCRGINTLTGYFDWKDSVFISQDKLKGLEHYLIYEGDIILAMDRPWISSGLKVCIYLKSERETYLVQRVARIRVNHPLYKYFIYFLIKSKLFEKHCCPTETTVPHISPIELKSFLIPYPSKNDLIKFNNLFEKIYFEQNKMLSASNATKKLFNSLSQQAFSGSL